MYKHKRTAIAVGVTFALLLVGLIVPGTESTAGGFDLSLNDLSRIAGKQFTPEDCYHCELDHMEGTPNCTVGNPCQGCVNGNSSASCAYQSVISTGISSIKVFRVTPVPKDKWIDNELWPCQFIHYCYSDPIGNVTCADNCGELFNPLVDCYNCEIGDYIQEIDIQAKNCRDCPW
jgi:hypothetical protein